MNWSATLRYCFFSRVQYEFKAPALTELDFRHLHHLWRHDPGRLSTQFWAPLWKEIRLYLFMVAALLLPATWIWLLVRQGVSGALGWLLAVLALLLAWLFFNFIRTLESFFRCEWKRRLYMRRLRGALSTVRTYRDFCSAMAQTPVPANSGKVSLQAI